MSVLNKFPGAFVLFFFCYLNSSSALEADLSHEQAYRVCSLALATLPPGDFAGRYDESNFGYVTIGKYGCASHVAKAIAGSSSAVVALLGGFSDLHSSEAKTAVWVCSAISAVSIIVDGIFQSKRQHYEKAQKTLEEYETNVVNTVMEKNNLTSKLNRTMVSQAVSRYLMDVYNRGKEGERARLLPSSSARPRAVRPQDDEEKQTGFITPVKKPSSKIQKFSQENQSATLSEEKYRELRAILSEDPDIAEQLAINPSTYRSFIGGTGTSPLVWKAIRELTS